MTFAADRLAPPPAGSWPAPSELGLVDAAADALRLAAAAQLCALPQPDLARLGVVTALQAEADCLRCYPDGRPPLTYVSGGSALRARAGRESCVWR